MARKNKSMLHSFRMSFIYPISIFLALILCIVIFLIIHITTKDVVYLYVLMGISIGLFLVFAVASFLAIKYMYNLYYSGLYKVTKNNFKSLYNNETKLLNYPKYSQINEIEDLNSELEKVRVTFSHSTLVSPKCDYSSLPFEYVSGLEEVVTLKSLVKNLDNLIFISNSYRNALFEVFYDLEDDVLNDKEIAILLSVFKEGFKDYSDKIFALNENKKSIFVYVPHVDTFSTIRERLIQLMQNVSVCKDTAKGIETINARVVLVAYPYSDTSEMIHDLNYAKQEGKVINIYLPNRDFNTNARNNLMKDSINLNIISRALESLGDLKIDGSEFKVYLEKMEKAIRTIQKFLDVDEAGVMLRNINTFEYFSAVNISKSTNPLLNTGSIIDKEWVDMMAEDKDIDNSYYFADRGHCNNSLGRYFDRYRIHSGFYYIIENDQKEVLGVIYFFNRSDDFILNSYLREGLVLFSNRISNFAIEIKSNRDFTHTMGIIESILMLSNYGTYRIDKETHEIIAYSGNMKGYFPNIALHTPCYKALYGLEKPCAKCPLSTSRKMLEKYKDFEIETSLNLVDDTASRYINLLTKAITSLEEGTQERFNKDYLVNSYPSLVEDVQNCYSAKGRGHLLILRVDNIDELISKYGSEVTIAGLRNFLSNIKNKFNSTNNIYYFNSQSFGVLLQDLGQIDVVNRCEVIYEISKQKYFPDTEDEALELKISYLPMVYPSSYPTAYDFLKNAQRFFDSKSYTINQDLITFEENGYVRSASKNEFMLSVIDDKFGNSTFTALLQPYLRAKQRNVYGVEMLLRLTDDYRKITFNADELIKTAAKNGKMKIISDSLINFAGNLYQKQGSSIFKVFGLKRFSINIDYSYFLDPDAIDNLLTLIKSYNFPKEFIAFEIPEWDVKDHKGEYKFVLDRLKKEDIVFVCDNYSEKFISLEQLNDIGFTEIKIGRSLGGFVDSDPQKAAALKSIMERAKALGMQTSVVGLENHEQYAFIRDIDDQAFVQGFYFFKPLDKNALINALRQMNAPQ